MSQIVPNNEIIDVRKVPVGLIINTKARRGQQFFGQARTVLRAAGVNVVENYALTHAKSLPGLVAGMIGRGIKAIILGSGDGTISSIVDHLVNNEVTLGILPLGTANDFARTLDLPLQIEQACQVIAEGHTTKIDLGIVNGNYYVNVASVGFGAAVVEYTSTDAKKILGPLAYPWAAAQAALSHRPFKVKLGFSNQTIETEAIHIAVANGRFYGGGVIVAPSARIDDNELIVTIFEPMNPTELWQVGTHLRDGQYIRHPKVRTFRQVRRLHLEVLGHRRQSINVDGELSGHTPANFKIAPAALKVFVPMSYGKACLE